MLLAEGRLEEALSAAKKSLEQARLGSQPDAVCRALLDLGDVRRAEGDPAKAEACYREGLEEPAGMTTLCALKMQLATLLDFDGREAEAVTFYEEAISGFESLNPQDELLLSQLRNNLAMIYKGLGRFAKAESLCVQALNALEQRLGHDTEEVASLYNNLGSIYYTAGFSSPSGRNCCPPTTRTLRSRSATWRPRAMSWATTPALSGTLRGPWAF
jgi:tetratricopeptide (TPR) repeat protein